MTDVAAAFARKSCQLNIDPGADRRHRHSQVGALVKRAT
jgi:hypothetical protein